VEYRESEMQTMMRQLAREFALEQVKPVSVEYDRKTDPGECYPWELLEKASALGLRTMPIPEEYGGEGISDLLTYIFVIEELAYGDNGFASSLRSTIGNLTLMNALLREDQKKEWFPRVVADDRCLLAYANSEPNAGTDNLLMADVPGAATQTYAQKSGDEYVINGSKQFISNGGIAGLYILSCRTDKKLPLNQCRTIFLVPADTPGLSIGKFSDKLGRRLLLTAELMFDDMRIPARNLIGTEGRAAQEARRNPVTVDFLIPACSIGTLRACYDLAVEYAGGRVQGGKAIIHHQLVAAHLSEMRVRIEAARQLLYRQAWCWQNQHHYDSKLSLLLRTFIDQSAAQIVFQMNDVLGGMGSDRSMIAEKYIRDVYTSLHGPSIGSGLIRGAPGWQPKTEGLEV
jgi:alkylation response protein AidB-like acyl-CoA dehydrogenase